MTYLDWQQAEDERVATAYGRMDRNEKLLLLQLILEDIRGNWGWNLAPRLRYARRLADDLDLVAHKELLSECNDLGSWGFDGRIFRGPWESGGYEGGEAVHGLAPTICDRSLEFRQLADDWDILTHPQYRFEDWDTYTEKGCA